LRTAVARKLFAVRTILFSEALGGELHQLLRPVWSTPGLDLEFLVGHVVAGNKEMLDLLDEPLAEVINRAYVPMLMAALRHGDQSVVAKRFSILDLLRFDHTDQPGRNLAADRDRLVQEHQDIERVAVFGHGRRNEAEIKRKDHASRQHLA